MLTPMLDLHVIEIMTLNEKILFPAGLYFKKGDNYHWVMIQKTNTGFTMCIDQHNQPKNRKLNTAYSPEVVNKIACLINEDKIHGIMGNVVVLKESRY